MPTLIDNAHLPPGWERACGYAGTARWLAVYCPQSKYSDEAVCNDGQTSTAANARMYSDLKHRYHHAIEKVAEDAFGDTLRSDYWAVMYSFGSAVTHATHCLLLDLDTRAIYIDEISSGLEFVASQNLPVPDGEQEK